MPMVNWLAVIAAALSMFVIGGIWYSPWLFDKAWQRAANLSDADRTRGNVPLIFGLAFLLTLIMAANLAFFIAGPGVTLGFAMGAAIAAGFGWAALSVGVLTLFERRPLSYFLINGGYLTVGFAVMGLILGLWR
jgi:membrane-associated HD superfamily phosphohydrolase